MGDTTYNGWANYETWCVNLWLTNEGDSDDLVSELIESPDGSSSDIYELSKRLREYVEEMSPLADDASMFSDLLGAALSSCNWYEIAEHWMYDYMQNNPIEGNPAEYTIIPGMPTLTDETHPFWADPSDNDSYPNFWSAFEGCILHAIDNDYTSIVIDYSITEADFEYATGWKADRLINAQNDRNTKITGD